MDAVADAMRAVEEHIIPCGGDADEMLLNKVLGEEGDELLKYMDGHSDMTITSNGSIVNNANSEVEEEQEREGGEEEEEEETDGGVVAKEEVVRKKKKTDPRDRSGRYIANKRYRNTRIARKWGTSTTPGTMQEHAEKFSKQTGLHVHIILFDPATSKKMEFKSSNMLQMEELETTRQQPVQIPSQTTPSINRSTNTPTHHSPGKFLQLPTPINSTPFNQAKPVPLIPRNNDLATINMHDIGLSPINTYTQIKKEQKQSTKKLSTTKTKKKDKIDFKKLVSEEMKQQHPTIPGGADVARPKRKAAACRDFKAKKDCTAQECAICSVRYESARDRKLVEDKRFRWIGCDADGCEYWVHAFCGRFEITSRKLGDFFCPAHNKK